MPDELRIAIPGCDGLAPPSRDALTSAVERYGQQILAEAERIERSRRIAPGAPMITDTVVILADLNARNGQLTRARSAREKALSLVEYLATFASGAFAGYIAKPIGAVGFAICAVVGVLAHNSWGDNGS